MKKWVLIEGREKGSWYFIERPKNFEKNLIFMVPGRALRPKTVLPKAM